MSDKQGMILANDNLGTVYLNQGQYQKSLEYFSFALSLAESLGNKEDQGRVLGHLGNHSRDLGEHQKALDNYDRAISICEEIDSRYFLCNTLYNKAELLFKTGRMEEARLANGRALDIAREIQSKDILFKASLMEILLENQPASSAPKLQDLLPLAYGQKEKAELYFQLYSVTGNDDHKTKAACFLGNCLEKSNNVHYMDKIKFLDKNL
jgi:tetratricopeptide (TPR) repeat protein